MRDIQNYILKILFRTTIIIIYIVYIQYTKHLRVYARLNSINRI